MNRYLLLLPALLLALVLSGCGQSDSPAPAPLLSSGPASEVLVRVGDEQVRRADLARLLAASEATGRTGTIPGRDESSRMAFERFHLGLLEQRAGLREIAREKAPGALATAAATARASVAKTPASSPTPRAVIVLQAENQVLLQAITRAIEGPVSVSQAQVRAYMRQSPGEFTGPGAERRAAAQLIADRERQARLRTAEKLNTWLAGKITRADSVTTASGR